jgi:hypothetical protein
MRKRPNRESPRWGDGSLVLDYTEPGFSANALGASGNRYIIGQDQSNQYGFDLRRAKYPQI